MSKASSRKRRAYTAEEYQGLLENYRNAWQGLRMIREAVEALGPPGALLSEDGVLRRYGPEPIHEAQAIVDALTTMLSERVVGLGGEGSKTLPVGRD